MFVLAFAKVLLETRYFSTLKAGEVVVAQPAADRKCASVVLGQPGLAAFVSGFSYLYLPALVNTPGFRPAFFLQSPVFFIGVWAVVNGVFAADPDGDRLVLLRRQVRQSEGTRRHPQSPETVEDHPACPWQSSRAAFAIVFISDYLFKVDFRLWVIPVKAFTPDKFGIILMYLPFFLVFYVLHSIAVNSFNYVKQGKEWVNVAVLALFTTLGALVYVVIPVWHLLCHRKILDRGDDSRPFRIFMASGCSRSCSSSHWRSSWIASCTK